MTKTTCSVPECDRKVLAKSLCSAHYQRLKRGMDLAGVPIRGSVVSDECVTEDCDRRTFLRGWCYTHYRRWLTTGEASGEIEARVENAGKPCSIEACDRDATQRGWCHAHYQTYHLNGEVADRPIWDGNYRGDEIGYTGAHQRVYRLRGMATDHACVDCGLSGREWSYDHRDPDAKVDENTGLTFSTDVDHYEPRCKPCHYYFDLAARLVS